MPLDLQGPLDEFKKRTQQLRMAMVAIESAAQPPTTLTTARPDIDLTLVGAETRNTTNAMSLVLLASSFEEFVREEIGECADYLSTKYANLSSETRHRIRGEYWSVLVSRVSMNSNMMTKVKPKAPDPLLLGRIKGFLDSGRGFVVDDDPTHFDRGNFYHINRNFRPHIVNQLAGRLGIDDLLASVADSAKIKGHFGVTKKQISSQLLIAKLDEFYELRNKIVHSLSDVTGVGVDAAFDYIAVVELTAEGISGVLTRQTGKW